MLTRDELLRQRRQMRQRIRAVVDERRLLNRRRLADDGPVERELEDASPAPHSA